MAIGDITGTIASLEFDPDRGWYSNIIHIAGDVYVIAYEGSGNAGWLKTVEIQSNGTITDPVLDSFEFDHDYGVYPVMIHIAGDVYAIAYTGHTGGVGDFGWLKTVEIQSNGTITDPVLDSFEFDTSRCLYSAMIHIAGDVYAIAYSGPGDDGWLKTVEIQSNGTITDPVLDSFEFDTDDGAFPDMIYIAGDVYAIAYKGLNGNGWLKTVEIQSNGTITDPVLDSFEFDTDNCTDPDIIHVAGDVYVIAYEGSGNDGWLKTVEIQSDGTITDPVLSSFEFVSGWWMPTPRIIGVGDDAYAIAYMGNFDHCWLQTVEIQSNGTITGMIDSHDVDSSQSTVTPWIVHVAGDTYALTYGGPGNDGWLKTIGITTSEALAARHRFTGGLLHRAVH